jgi:adenosylhomocysteine nucleosidase
VLTKIGIITALRAEAHCLSREKLSPGRPHDISERLSLVLSGMGESNVGSAIESLLKHGVEGFISFGTAGALCDGIKAGDIVIPKNIVDANGAIHSVSSSWQEHLLQSLAKCRAAIHEGDLLTANTVISGPAEKNRLHNKSKAIAVDMESAQICAAATTANMPTVALRFIVDDASMTIHDAILKNTDAYGHLGFPALLLSIAKQPLLIGELIKLGRAFSAAKHSMEWIGSHAEQILLPNPRS